MKGQSALAHPRSPLGLAAMGVFLFFGAANAGLAAITLLWRGNALDQVWSLNPLAYRELVPLGRLIGVPLLLLNAALFAGGVGWFQRRLWGWRLLLTAAQLAGNFVNLLLGRMAEGALGLTIAGALFSYLFCPSVKAAFA